MPIAARARAELLVLLGLLPRVGALAATLGRLAALVLLLLLIVLLLSARAVARVAVVLLAVGRELRLLDRGIVRLLLGRLEVLRVHHEEVVAAREDHGLLVG